MLRDARLFEKKEALLFREALSLIGDLVVAKYFCKHKVHFRTALDGDVERTDILLIRFDRADLLRESLSRQHHEMIEELYHRV